MSNATPVVQWDAPEDLGNQAGMATGSTYRPGRTRSQVAVALISLTTLSYVLDGLLSLYGVELLSDLDRVTDAQLTAYDDTVAVVGLISAGLYILAGIFFLRWLRRAVTNVRALTGDEADHTPNMAVVWWFVPIGNLFKPYAVVKDVWNRLALTPEGKRRRGLRVWWLCFIFGTAVSTAYARLPPPRSVQDFNDQATLNTLSDVLLVLAGALLVTIILEIERRSRARAGLVTQGAPMPGTQTLSAAGPKADTPADWWPDDAASNAPRPAAPPAADVLPAPRAEPAEPAG